MGFEGDEGGGGGYRDTDASASHVVVDWGYQSYAQQHHRDNAALNTYWPACMYSACHASQGGGDATKFTYSVALTGSN